MMKGPAPKVILKSAGRNMVLAAMLKESVLRKAREEGFAEGLRIGRPKARRELRERRLKRWNEAFDRFGFEADGVVMPLPLTPEVERFLDGEAAE